MSRESGSKDWIGNQKSIYTTLGASNHTDKERQQHDYYATEPKAMELLLTEESFIRWFGNVLAGKGICQKFWKRTVLKLSARI